MINQFFSIHHRDIQHILLLTIKFRVFPPRYFSYIHVVRNRYSFTRWSCKIAIKHVDANKTIRKMKQKRSLNRFLPLRRQ